MKIARALLAAGQSKRFGKAKLLEKFSNTLMVDRALMALSGSDELAYIVVGDQAEKIKKNRKGRFIFNPDFKKGMGTSIAVLVKEIQSKNYEALLIHLCDLPLVTQKDIDKLILEYLKQPETPIASEFKNNLAPPCVIPKSLFGEFAQLQEDHGAKSILLKSKVRSFSLPAAAYDVDTQEDLDKIIGLQLAVDKS